MNALQQLVITAGAKTHEAFYGATFIWNGAQYPCTHGGVMRNPPLMEGGYSPITEVPITVRDESFGDSSLPRPIKGNLCFLQPDPNNPTVFSLQIGTVITSVGDVLQTFICRDADQGA